MKNKTNRNLNSYSVNEGSTNTKYSTSRVLTIKLYLANPNNDSTPDS